MSAPFGIGDIVQLKSGGPPMTVERIDEHSKLVTAVFWMQDACGVGVDNNGLKRMHLNASLLKNVETGHGG